MSKSTIQPDIQPVLLTMGDAAGVGPELLAKTWTEGVGSAFKPDAPGLVVGDPDRLAEAMAMVGSDSEFQIRAADRWDDLRIDPGERRVIWVWTAGKRLSSVRKGRPDAQSGAAAGHWVQAAAQACLSGRAKAMVTAPIHKEAMHAAGSPWDQYPGHTELLQSCAQAHTLRPVPVRMMLANDRLRTVLVSIHVSLRKALEAVTVENVWQTLEVTRHALARLLGREPLIWVAGVNPHAGEGGIFGDEEIAVLSPCIHRAKALGWRVEGPFPPDTVFMSALARSSGVGAVDVVIAMYHDQGLIPIKLHGLDQGVNITLGLPFVRTSPDHGTALDLAGTGKVRPQSWLHALAWAQSLSLGGSHQAQTTLTS